MTFNGGRFKKQIFHSHQKVVYHDDESDYYIYHTGNEWVVNNIVVPFSLGTSNLFIYVIS